MKTKELKEEIEEANNLDINLDEFERGYQQATQDFIKTIDFKIKNLKKRKHKLLTETSKYTMQMSIEELEELKLKKKK